MTQNTLGYIIQQKIIEADISRSKAAELAGLKVDVLLSLIRNEVYLNNIPIRLIERLFKAINLQLSKEVKETILLTSKTLKQYEDDNKVPKSGWNELWENEEAWNKYINRLEELLAESTPTTTVGGSVEEAARRYSIEMVPMGGRQEVNLLVVRKDIEAAFLAGAAHAQQNKMLTASEENVFYTDTEFPGIKVRMTGIREFITDTFSESSLTDDKMNSLLKGIGYFACHRIKEAQQSPSLTVDIVEQLEKVNPYWFEKDRNEYAKHGNMVWGDCCAKLRELIAAQPAAPSVGVLVNALEKIKEWCEDSGLTNCDIGNKQHMAIYHSLHLAKNAIESYQTPSNTEGQEEQGKYKLPGHDQTMELLNNVTLRPNKSQEDLWMDLRDDIGDYNKDSQTHISIPKKVMERYIITIKQ